MKKTINIITLLLVTLCAMQQSGMASSHREAPLISNDPLADNTDLYAFKSPSDPEKIILVANYIPFEHPAGGPNWYSFGTNIRYEIHIDNNTATPGDDIIYRFTFQQVIEDGSTFFNIRLGKQNLKTTYTCERSINGGTSFTVIKTGGLPPVKSSYHRPIAANATPDTACNSIVVTSSSNRLPFGNPSILGINCRLALPL